MLTSRSRRILQEPPAPYDWWLILTVCALSIIGLLMIASASIEISAAEHHEPLFYFYRQFVFILLSIAIGSILVQFKIATLEKLGGPLLIASMLLLSLVLLPGLGKTVHGSTRWLGISFFRIEVSEIAKLTVVIYLAGYLYRRHDEIKNNVSGFLKPLGLLSIIAILLLKEPDFGATVVILITALGMMFLAGTRLRPFIILMFIIGITLFAAAISEPYRVRRLTGFLNPWANPFANGYQLTQSLIAFGRGGVFGVGLGKGIQKLFYLPEAHTDFLFAVIAEEFGFLGLFIVISLFVVLVVKIFYIGKKAQYLGRHFAGFLAYGFGLWIVIQVIVSIGVNTGVFPTKGLTLPLVSYGGSSLLIMGVVIALIMRIDYENRMILLGLRNG